MTFIQQNVHDLDIAISSLEQQRAAVVIKKKELEIAGATLKNQIRQNKKLPPLEYKAICKKQDQCRRDILATEIEMNKFQDQISKKISLREAIRHELRVEAYTDVPSKLTAIRDYYINFAADRTRVASMRAMAAEFAEKLEVIIKTI